MSEAEKKGVNPEVLNLSKQIVTELKVKADGVTDVADGIYVKTLPEGLDEKIVRSVSKHNSNFVAATAHAVGHLALEAMSKDKKLNTVTAHVPTIGHDYVDVAVHREKSFVNPQDKDNPIVKQGAVDLKYHVQGGVAKAGQLKHVRAALAEEAAKALKK